MASVIWDSEKELEDYFYKHISESQLCPVTDERVDYVIRQFRVDPYGIIDLIGFSISPYGITVHIYELKKKKITVSAIAQVLRYKSGIKRLFDFKNFSNSEGNYDLDIICYVVASEICMDDDTVYLYNELDNVVISDIKYDLESGVIFNQRGHEWHKVNDSAHFTNNTSIDEVISGFHNSVISYQEYLASNSTEENNEG